MIKYEREYLRNVFKGNMGKLGQLHYYKQSKTIFHENTNRNNFCAALLFLLEESVSVYYFNWYYTFFKYNNLLELFFQ